MTPYRIAATQPLHDEPSEGLAAQSLKLENCHVFFDFDNTITAFDVLDGIIEQFSVNRDWVAYEEAWKKGKIGSRQCLDGQLRSIRVERAQLHAYLRTVGIDPAFGRLLALLRRHRTYQASSRAGMVSMSVHHAPVVCLDTVGMQDLDGVVQARLVSPGSL